MSRLYRCGWYFFTALALFSTASMNIRAAEIANKVVYLDQGWSEGERQWYYHTSQGTQILPYAWFMALEQPALLAAKESPLFRNDDYLAKMGFIPDPKNKYNPDALPVGFAKEIADDKKEWVGISCAACHNGEIRYQGTRISIDGGGAMQNINAFSKVLFEAMIASYLDPFRFKRFATRVLGSDYPKGEDQLKAALKQFVDNGKHNLAQTLKQSIKRGDGIHPFEAGMGRVDALARGGNTLFGFGMGIPENLVLENGPVSFPPVWDMWMFDWEQYGGQIRQPLGRNLTEALGVFTPVVLKGAQADLFKSQARLGNLREIELSLQRLKPAPWPEAVLGKIDRTKWAQGEKLFQENCGQCHDPKWVGPDQYGNYELAMPMIPVEKIGTDPNTVMNLITRKVNTGDLGLGTIPAGVALKVISDNVMDRLFTEHKIATADRPKWGGCRDNLWRAEPAYRPRPLDGLWSSPPFLHNGSVPSIYQLLSPANERDKIFYVGSKEFNPVNLGLSTAEEPGTTRFDTSLQGNRNTGHEFRDGPRGNGVIGRALSRDERYALIEFLKDVPAPKMPPRGPSKAGVECPVPANETYRY